MLALSSGKQPQRGALVGQHSGMNWVNRKIVNLSKQEMLHLKCLKWLRFSCRSKNYLGLQKQTPEVEGTHCLCNIGLEALLLRPPPSLSQLNVISFQNLTWE